MKFNSLRLGEVYFLRYYDRKIFWEVLEKTEKKFVYRIYVVMFDNFSLNISEKEISENKFDRSQMSKSSLFIDYRELIEDLFKTKKVEIYERS